MKVIDTLVGMCFRDTITSENVSTRMIVTELDYTESYVIEIDEFGNITEVHYDSCSICNDYYIITKEEFLEAYDKAVLKQKDFINSLIK